MKSTTLMLTHPEVLDVITGFLVKHGIVRRELDDAVAEVQTRALEAVRDRDPPAEISAWQALCTAIARRYVIDEHRKAKVREQYDEGLCEDPDASAARTPSGEPRDPVDARRQLAELERMIAAGTMPEHTGEILEGVAAGMTHKEIAEELGITPNAVRIRLRTMRELFRRRLSLLGMLVLMALLFGIVGPAGWLATRTAPPTLPTPSPAPTPEHEPTPSELAARLRRDARNACDAHLWQECVAKLDEARAIDPAGDAAPEVRRARAFATQGLEERPRNLDAKPRP